MKISLTSGLMTTRTGGPSRTSTAGGNRDRVVIGFETDGIDVELDEEDFLQRIGRPLARELRRRMLAGLTPNGTPAPAVSAATLERRKYRRAQLERGGQAKDPRRYPDARYQAQKRFYNGRVARSRGGWHIPGARSDRGFVGVESGLLARSIAFGKDRVTGKYVIFFANNRAIIGKDGESPAMRVFERPEMRITSSALQGALAPIMKRASKQILARQARRAVGAAMQTFRSLQSLGRAVDREVDRLADYEATAA